MTPKESLEFVEERMLAYYPLGDYRVHDEAKKLK